MSTSSNSNGVRVALGEDHLAGVVAQVATRARVQDHVAWPRWYRPPLW